MKKAFLLLVILVVMLASNACTSAVKIDENLHLPFEITGSDTFNEVVKKAENGTALVAAPLPALDGTISNSYYLDAYGKPFFGVPLNFIEISPDDDHTEKFSSMEYIFSDGIDYPNAFITIYNSICESYGAADSTAFVDSGLKDFPTNSDAAMTEFMEIANGTNNYVIMATWYNVRVQMARYSNYTSLTLSFSAQKYE